MTKAATRERASRAEAPDSSLPSGAKFIDAAEAQDRLYLTADQFRGVVERGLLSIYRVPGCHPRFLLSEVEALARRSFTPATAGIGNDED